jgi:hypothetical protein
MDIRRFQNLWLALGLIGCLLGLGCEPVQVKPSGSPPVASAAGTDVSTSAGSGTSDRAGSPPAAVVAPVQAEVAVSFPPPRETADDAPPKKEVWEAQSIRGSRVGYGYTSVRDVDRDGEALELTRHVSLLSIEREGQPVQQWIRLATWTSPAGELRRFETEMTGGGGDMKARGVVKEDKLTIATATAGKTTSQTIGWKPEWGGFDATERSLTTKPMQPGEKRTIFGLLPIFHVVGETSLTAGDYEKVKLPDGERRLLRIDSVMHIGGQQMESVQWCDEQGETYKSFIPGIGQEGVRTSREQALSGKRTGPLDLIVASIVPVKGTLPNAPSTKRVVYRAHVNQGRVADVFDNCLSQRVTVKDDQTALLEIIAVRPGDPTDAGKQEMPTEDDTAANNLVQSDDAGVVKLANSVATDEKDPWKLATALERFVHEGVHKKNFSQAFATAAEVAEQREGDCTEHAVLLAGLCRARGLPGRVAFGLVYYPPQGGFAYHMWNEVWIEDRWVPLDATLGRGGIGADHVKLADSNLKGSTAYSAMLPVIQVFGRLELEVLEVE